MPDRRLSEFDLENALWIVPAAHMGTKRRSHRVAQTDAAIAVLKPRH
jgi:hypothetical protein